MQAVRAHAVCRSFLSINCIFVGGQVLAADATREAMQPYVKVFQTLLRCGAAWHAPDSLRDPRARETASHGDMPLGHLWMLARCLAATVMWQALSIILLVCKFGNWQAMTIEYWPDANITLAYPGGGGLFDTRCHCCAGGGRSSSGRWRTR